MFTPVNDGKYLNLNVNNKRLFHASKSVELKSLLHRRVTGDMCNWDERDGAAGLILITLVQS